MSTPQYISGHSANPDLALRKVPAVTRAISLLRILSGSGSPMTLNELSRAAQIIPSTCLGILRVLLSENLIELEAGTKRYQLSSGMLSLSRPLLRNDSPGRRVQPYLDNVARKFKVTATLVEVLGLRHFIVVAVSRAEGLRLQIDIGRRAPALISATGRCVAAFGGYGTGELRAGFSGLRWENPPGFRHWMRQVEMSKRRGYGIDQNHYIRGMTAISAPVLDQEETLRYCVTAVGMSGQVLSTGISSIARELLHVAETVLAPPKIRADKRARQP